MMFFSAMVPNPVYHKFFKNRILEIWEWSWAYARIYTIRRQRTQFIPQIFRIIIIVYLYPNHNKWVRP